MGKRSKVDIHYSLRASERDAPLKDIRFIVTYGSPVEKRRSFFRKKEKNIKAYVYGDQVHILSSDLKKRITVVPYSRRRWKFIVK